MGMELGVSRNREILVFENRMLWECSDLREDMSWIEKIAQRGISRIYFTMYIILQNKEPQCPLDRWSPRGSPDFVTIRKS
jgi:hypothetical protein